MHPDGVDADSARPNRHSLIMMPAQRHRGWEGGGALVGLRAALHGALST